MENKNKIQELIYEAKAKIEEATNLLSEVEVSEKVGENYVVRREFESIVYDVAQVRESVDYLTEKNVTGGVLDRLEETIKEKLKTFFKEQFKQKKYEGSLMEMGFKVVERKVIDGSPDPRFIVMKENPNTKAIEEYRKATVSEDNPDGKLPEGIKIKTFEYVTYKEVLNGKD